MKDIDLCYARSIGLHSTLLVLSKRMSPLNEVLVQTAGRPQQDCRERERFFLLLHHFERAGKTENNLSVRVRITLSPKEKCKAVDIMKQKSVTLPSNLVFVGHCYVQDA